MTFSHLHGRAHHDAGPRDRRAYGTGKTLPGLVIADWLRRTGGRVAYAFPTRQLARQVSVMASREGVPAAVLVGPAASWSVADQTRYESAESLALVTYSTLFDSNPKLAQPEVLLFELVHVNEAKLRDLLHEFGREPVCLQSGILGEGFVSGRVCVIRKILYQNEQSERRIKMTSRQRDRK